MSFCCNIGFTKQTFQLLEQQWMARSIESPGRGELLLDILEIENDGQAYSDRKYSVIR